MTDLREGALTTTPQERTMSGQSIYTEDLAILICDRISDGESLKGICRDESMPDKSTVLKWLRKNPEFQKLYWIAKEESADIHAEEILDIADDTSGDWMDIIAKDGNTKRVPDLEHIARSRLRVDTRKWIACKLKPRRYGDKVENTHVGDEKRPIQISTVDAKL